MRLDRFISNATGLSRAQTHKLIKAGEVTLAGEVAQSPQLNITAEQVVTVSGETVRLPQPLYLMMHKPAGYVCATEDGMHPIVIDLVQGDQRAQHPTDPLQIVGRLDLDTTGLLLLTTDGQWNHRVTSPRSQCRKTYRTELADPISAEQIEALKHGVLLRGEKQPTLPCTIQVLDTHHVDISIQEGKYHQVKRMFAAVGNKVVQLHRYSIGGIVLDSDLRPGEFRPLTQAEIDSIST